MSRALSDGMRAQKLEDLLIYTKALEGIDAVCAILRRPKLINDFDLHRQLSESSGKIPGHIGEGFGQLTDRHFAHYLGIARGSALETRGHLATARLLTTLVDSRTLVDSKTLPTPSTPRLSRAT
jgi:four helix bundle protein